MNLRRQGDDDILAGPPELRLVDESMSSECALLFFFHYTTNFPRILLRVD